MTPQILAYLVISCFERRYPKQNTVARLKLKFLPPSIFRLATPLVAERGKSFKNLVVSCFLTSDTHRRTETLAMGGDFSIHPNFFATEIQSAMGKFCGSIRSFRLRSSS